MIIKDIMTPDPEQIQASASLAQAAEKLFENDIRHLPVMREGRAIGMLSDKDLRGFVWSFSSDAEDPDQLETFSAKAVSELMSGNLLSVGPEDQIQEAIDIMLDHKVGAVAVIDPHTEKLVGIVSYVDILRVTRELLAP